MKLYNLCKVCNAFGPCGTSGPLNKNSLKETDVVPVLISLPSHYEASKLKIATYSCIKP